MNRTKRIKRKRIRKGRESDAIRAAYARFLARHPGKLGHQLTDAQA